MQGVLVCLGQARLVRHSAKFHEVLERHNLRYLLALLIGVFYRFDRPSLERVGLWRESCIQET